jgi:surface polysaccharide O-acyltransferase-like enzyme
MRLLWADILKILAMFGVILLHVSAPFVVPFEETFKWWVGNIYDSLSRWCVPLFVMVSGALVLPKAGELPLRQFFRVRVVRILVPFLAWSAAYFLYRIYVRGEDLALSAFFIKLITEPIYYHLWFIYMLIVLYLFAPALSAFLNKTRRKYAWYLVALWFLWASILPFFDTPLDFETYFTPDMDDYSPLRLSGYFLLGYLLKDWHIQSADRIFLALLIFLAGGAATIFGTYWMSRSAGEFHPFFYKYFSVTVVMMTVSLFIFIKSIFHAPSPVAAQGEKRFRLSYPKILRLVGGSVFGIYLSHALVLELLSNGRLGFTVDHTSAFGLEMPLLWSVPFFALSIFVASMIPVLLIRLVPILRKIIT